MNYTIREEVWKPVAIPDYSHYHVSSYGRVRNTNRNQKVMKNDYKNGYPFVRLSANAIKKGFYVHRLVAGAFIIKDSPGKEHVNHINGIKSDNRVSNLEWCTPAENIKHAWETGLMVTYREKFSQFRDPDFLKPIYSRLKSGDTLTTLAGEYDIDVSSLSAYLKDQYGKKHIEDIYHSEIHGKIPEYKIDKFYRLILSGYTIQDISNNYNVDEGVRYRIYRSYGRKHVTSLLDKNVSLKRDDRRKKWLKSISDEIDSYYKMMAAGETFSDIGKVFGVSHKTIRKRLNLKYGKDHIDKLRFK